MTTTPDYDDRYLAGVLLFNRGDYFEAHEVWEALWLDNHGPERRFVQGLIQAAVGLCHYNNGNTRGAAKLYHSAKAYMDNYPSPYLGLDSATFWNQMAACFAPVLADPTRRVELDADRLPAITLDPEPAAWPNPEAFLHDQDD